MKKSFKKAGAAVLSMAMLLSMGAVSLPVYAVDEYHPATVEVALMGTATQDTDPYREYEYMKGSPEATVTMYKVAELGDNGWQWIAPLMNADGTSKVTTTDFTTLVHEDADQVLDTDGATMMALASEIERLIRAQIAAGTDLSAYLIGSDTIEDENGDGTADTGSSNAAKITVPTDVTKTKNVIGYYLIMTNATDADVLIQPTLISLKNGEKNADNVTKVNVKGKRIFVDKKVTNVVDKLANKNIDTSTTENKNISTNGDSAVVSKQDTIKFEIDVPVPSYDPHVTSIDDLVITDTPDDGVKVRFPITLTAADIAKYTGLGSAQVGNTASVPQNLKVWVSTDGTLDANDTELDTTKYSIGLAADNKSFTVTVSGKDNILALDKKHLIISFDGEIDQEAFNTRNLTANDVKNTATMEYGNQYSNGGGDGQSTDETVIRSAGVDIRKMAKELTIGDDNKTGTETLKIVGGVIFELKKLAADEGEYTMGYAISDGTDGKLYELVEDNVNGTITIPGVYVDPEAETKVLKKFAKSTTQAYTNIENGTYKLYELSAPAGYKDWGENKVTFTITATEETIARDATGNETHREQKVYKKEFAGTVGADTFSTERVITNPNHNDTTTMQWNDTAKLVDTTVLNELADKLPATGGIGTVLFTAGGISIVLIAGALFVMYMKKRNAEDEE